MAESSEKITKSRILVYSFIQSSIQWLCAEHWFGGTKVNRALSRVKARDKNYFWFRGRSKAERLTEFGCSGVSILPRGGMKVEMDIAEQNGRWIFKWGKSICLSTEVWSLGQGAAGSLVLLEVPVCQERSRVVLKADLWPAKNIKLQCEGSESFEEWKQKSNGLERLGTEAERSVQRVGINTEEKWWGFSDLITPSQSIHFDNRFLLLFTFCVSTLSWFFSYFSGSPFSVCLSLFLFLSYPTC